MLSKRGGKLAYLGVLVLATAPIGARASTTGLGFEGTISPPTDDFVVTFDFTISSASANVSIATLSNGGGKFDSMAAPYGGDTVDSGGFETMLSLFDSAGNLIATSTTCGSLGSDACMGGAYTTLEPLDAGSYTLALTEYGNYPNDTLLADGFNWDGTGDQPGGPFPDGVGGNLTGNYALEILNVPEPGGLWLVGVGMLLIGAAVWRRQERC